MLDSLPNHATIVYAHAFKPQDRAVWRPRPRGKTRQYTRSIKSIKDMKSTFSNLEDHNRRRIVEGSSPAQLPGSKKVLFEGIYVSPRLSVKTLDNIISLSRYIERVSSLSYVLGTFRHSFLTEPEFLAICAITAAGNSTVFARDRHVTLKSVNDFVNNTAKRYDYSVPHLFNEVNAVAPKFLFPRRIL